MASQKKKSPNNKLTFPFCAANSSGLYGLKKGNRSGINLWGKNQFNSTFPAALACWMRDQSINPVYLSLKENLEIEVSDQTITFEDVFNTTAPNDEIEFYFESPFKPYEEYASDTLDHIDLVVKHNDEYRRALEVKLTVLPDSTTEKKLNHEDWGAELVIRPDSTSYAALGIYHSLRDQATEVKKILRKAAEEIDGWDNKAEILKHRNLILQTINEFQAKYYECQQPFLLQPIWKTQGKSPELDENAFDIFVWSDMALVRAIVDQAINDNGEKVTRYLRASARLLRCLYDLFSKGETNIGRIFRGMHLGNQTDKECSLGGRKTNQYMKHPRLTKPSVRKEELVKIILGGGEMHLSPERRFDASIFFTAKHLFEKSKETAKSIHETQETVEKALTDLIDVNILTSDK